MGISYGVCNRIFCLYADSFLLSHKVGMCPKKYGACHLGKFEGLVRPGNVNSGESVQYEDITLPPINMEPDVRRSWKTIFRLKGPGPCQVPCYLVVGRVLLVFL